MKKLNDYVIETEQWIASPAAGDEFDIEIEPDEVIATYVIESTENSVILAGTPEIMSLMEDRGLLGERIGTYGAVGYGGMGQTFFEKEQEIAEHGGGIGPKAHWQSLMQEQPVEEGTALSVPQLATISDEALDKAYGYGRSTPGNTFGWQANLMSAAYAKKLIDAGVTDIEKISDAIHKGWNVTAQKFVQNPDQFDDTEKLRQAGKLDAKLQQRAKLMKINYAQLDNDEQEKDRVVARALLQAIKGQRGVAEGAVKAQDIELQDYKTMTPQQFQAAYGMKKADWAMKHRDLIDKEHLQVDWTGKTGFDYVRETSDYMRRMLELAGLARSVEEDNSGLFDKSVKDAPVSAMGELPEDAVDPINQYGQDAEEMTGAMTAEAEYQGRKVPLGKPMQGDVKKFKVYVRDPKTGNIKKVNFGHGGKSAKRAGEKTLSIKKSNPARRRSFRARHNCDNPGPRTKARYWSCRMW